MKRQVMAIDPGTEKSALIIWDGVGVVHAEVSPNAQVAAKLRDMSSDPGPVLVIEMIESQGMAVGKETFETVYWIGVFAECYGLLNTNRLGRKAVKVHHCNSTRATDANIRAAIVDRFGGKTRAFGSKKEPGPIAGITGHKMAALALALAWAESWR